MTYNRHAPLENIDESSNSSSGDNLLQPEINTATQDQINNNGHRQEKKETLIIGDSMLKGIKRWKINKKLKFTNASVNYFPGAYTSDMKHYTKPPIRKYPNAKVVLIHTGTNGLSSDSTPIEIATNIMDFAADVKKNLKRSYDVIISSVISKGDQLQQKTLNVNKELKELCVNTNIRYIEHGTLHPRNHFNRSKLHFDFYGNFLFLNNICK